jgi:hypothetical protein
MKTRRKSDLELQLKLIKIFNPLLHSSRHAGEGVKKYHAAHPVG